MDFLGPIRSVRLVAALPDTTALTTCKSLMEKIVLRHGPPKIIVTDRGSNFTAELFRELSKALGVKHRTTTAYHPQSNGHTERFNQTVVDMIANTQTTPSPIGKKCYTSWHSSWHNQLAAPNN